MPSGRITPWRCRGSVADANMAGSFRSRYCDDASLLTLHRGQIAAYNLERFLVFAARTEFDDLGRLVGAGRVSGRQIVDVAGFEDLLPVRVVHAHPTTNHVTPMGALAAIIRQSLEERSGAHARRERLQGNVHVSPFGLADLDSVAGERDRHVQFGSAHLSTPL